MTSFTFRRKLSRKTLRLIDEGGAAFTKRLTREMHVASELIGARGAALMRAAVRGGNAGLAHNTRMTLKMKSGSTPVVDSGELVSHIESVVHRGPGASSRVEVGLIVGRTPADVIRYGQYVHRGFTIVVTKKMQAMFDLLNKHTSNQWARGSRRPLPPLTSNRARALLAASSGVIPKMKEGHVIRVKARPFATVVFHNRELQAFMRAEYIKAVRRAVR